MAAKSPARGPASKRPATADPLDDIVTSLYAVELGSFTAERTALTKRLRSEGERELAAAAAKVRKPTLAAWSIDAVARADAVGVAALVDIGERLRTAQAALLEGAAPAELRRALDERRAIIRPLADAAVAHVVAAGGNGEGARDDIVATFEAASIDSAVAADLTGGRLARTARGPVGFDLIGLGGVAAEPAGSKRDDGEARAQARKRADEARAVAETAQAEVEVKRAELERFEAALEQAHDDAEHARTALAEAERGAADARLAADQAERAAD